MRHALLVLAAAGAVAAAFVPRARAAGEVTLDVRPVARSVKLGEDVALVLTVDNPTLDPVSLPDLRLASDAVTIRVRGAGLQPATVTRLYGEFVEDDDGALRLETTPTRAQVVPTGGRLTRELRFAAVAAGTLELRVTLRRPDGADLVAEPVEVEVAAPGGARRLLARVETTAGAFAMELDGTRAFNAVSQFWSLARSGFYGDLPIHRVVPGVLVQTGDPRGDGTGTAGWYLPSEAQDQPLARGVVALARGAHEDSMSSQWFVTLADGEGVAERLPGAYTTLGTVTEGLEVLDALAAEPPADGARPRVLRVRTSVR